MPGMRILMLLVMKTCSSTKTFMDVDGEDCKSYSWPTTSFYCQISTVQSQDSEHDMIQMIEKIQIDKHWRPCFIYIAINRNWYENWNHNTWNLDIIKCTNTLHCKNISPNNLKKIFTRTNMKTITIYKDINIKNLHGHFAFERNCKDSYELRQMNNMDNWIKKNVIFDQGRCNSIFKWLPTYL